MPTYEYYCAACGKRFDIFQGINDAPTEKCPSCGKSVKRVISGGSGFIMKGSSVKSPACPNSCCSENACGMYNQCH